MNPKSIVLFVVIFIVAGVSFGIPMLVSGGSVRDTHSSDILLVTISPSPTISTAQVQTKQAFAQMFFSPTASFTITASLQPSETPNPTITLEGAITPSGTSTLFPTPTATHPFITFTSHPDRNTTPIPPTSTPQPTNPPPTSTIQPRPTNTQRPPPTTEPPPTATEPPPTSTEPPATETEPPVTQD